MPDLSVARHLPGAHLPQALPGGGRTRPAWWPTWSVPAGLRTLRAVLVIPSLFALTFEGFGNLQMALFAAFGGFASLVMASFGGSRRDKLTAHFGLAVIGSLGLIIGTAVNGIAWLAVLVTIPVTFGIFFAGVAGPNAASGVTAALLPYVLPVATPGTISMIPDRLAGWWLASVVSTAVVLLIPAPSPGDRLRAVAAGSARTLGGHLEASARGTATAADIQACQEAKHQLMTAFASTPYRPVGLATADQGMASVVQLLEWCTVLLADATEGHPNLDQAAQPDRELFVLTAVVLRQTGDLLAGTTSASPDITAMERQREAATAYHQSAADQDIDSVEIVARHAFHAQAIALVVRNIVADALIATRRADPETIAARRLGWYGAQPEGTMAERRAASIAGAMGVLTRHASFRSVWFLNSLRGSLALAAAVLVADISDVQHGFWVVLGTLSVLRSNAASTESTALRALGGTLLGFVLGALLLLGIGTSTPALWAALPIAVAVAAYAPGALPFTFGQAAFTVVVLVLFNLLAPAGWRVGLLRIEDVAIGCLVSLVVGVAVLAAGRRVRGRRRPRRRVPPRCRLPDAIGGLGPRHPGRATGRGRRGGHRRDQARRGPARLPGRAGRQAAVQGGPVDAGDGVHAAQADRVLAGRDESTRALQAPRHGLRAVHADAGHRGPGRLLRAGRGAGRAAGGGPGTDAGQGTVVHRPERHHVRCRLTGRRG